MTSTIKVNNIQNQCGANIINESSNTITIGASGDTVSLASGASQTGFGRTGTVDWQTSIKTSGFTAVSGEGYFCNTTGGAFTVTLPASPSVGDIVSVKDYANTFDSNALTLGRNGSNIGGEADNANLSTEGIAVTLVYADATKGWLVVDSGLQSEAPLPQYVAATGGTIATVCTDYKVHIFTGPGTFEVTNAGNAAGSDKIDYLVVAGGGGGGASPSGNDAGGGGGAGGFRESQCASFAPVYTASPLKSTTSLSLPATTYPVTVGGGGSVGAGTGGSGSNSSVHTITSAGGGGGGTFPGPPFAGVAGGSGGGGAGGNPGGAGTTPAGAGNTPPVSPPQGQPGADGATPPVQGTNIFGGGGGGALNSPQTAGTGTPGTSATGSRGGDGAGTAITPSPSYGTPGTTAGLRYFAGGGGAGSVPARPGCFQGTAPGGDGGGGDTGSAGTTNTGGGGSGGSNSNGLAGGSGIVILRYKFQ